MPENDHGPGTDPEVGNESMGHSKPGSLCMEFINSHLKIKPFSKSFY